MEEWWNLPDKDDSLVKEIFTLDFLNCGTRLFYFSNILKQTVNTIVMVCF